MPAVLEAFDKDIVWNRAGAPDIPFSGTFKGVEGMMKMFSIINSTIEMKEFIPLKFVSSGDTVVVMGHDEVKVKSTGKIYKTDWVQAFTFKDQKVIDVQIYLDSLAIARAFLP